jgi:CheY-like chemotaxis protein
MYEFNLACVIDDDSVARLMSEVMIFNYKIAKKTITFEQGKAALDYFKQFKNQPEMLPELILLDINMPVMNGWGFIQRFAKLQPTLSRKVVVYLVSSSVDPEDHNRASELESVSGFVIKPVSKSALEDMVRINMGDINALAVKN